MEINDKIKDGSVRVVTADKMTEIVKELGPEKAAREVDVVTTGTFGAMCSSGVFMNFGHADPPIKMQKVWLNDVEAYTGVAAVDAYIGATQLSEDRGMEYGGGHVIEDLVAGKPVDVRAIAYSTDCYPRKEIETTITIEDLNQAIMINPRNAYQRYKVATNSTDRTLYTYMGTLLPDYGNANYCGAGSLSPLFNDFDFETIGVGTRIFLCGAKGYVTWEGTQHEPVNNLGTIIVQGDLKEMSTEFLRGASFYRYGTTLYVGIGIPIPVLNEGIAKKTGIGDADIITEVLDYGVARRSRQVLRKVSYAELKFGTIEIGEKDVPTSPLSRFYMAKEIAGVLKRGIEKGGFFLTLPVERLPTDTTFKPMKQTKELPLVENVMTREVPTISKKASIEDASKLIKINIDRANVEAVGGETVLDVPCEKYERVVALFRSKGIEPILLPTSILLDEAKCLHCGACVSVCPTEVFGFEHDWRLRFDAEKCIQCGVCITACPFFAISLMEGI